MTGTGTGPAPALGPEQVRQLLAECVTVVRPGEVLVLRCPEGWTSEQAGEMQRWAEYWLADNAPDIRVLVVPHLDMAVVQPGADGEGVMPHVDAPAGRPAGSLCDP